MQYDAAHQLDIVMAQARVPPPGLATHGKGLDQNIFQGLAGGQAPAELEGLLLEFRVGHFLILGLQGADGEDRGLELFQIPGIRRAEKTGDGAVDYQTNAAEKPAQHVARICENSSSIIFI